MTKLGQTAIICLLCAVFSMNMAFARDLHMFIVAQANDPSHPDIYSNKDNAKMQRLVEDIAVATGMTLKKHYFEKSNLSEARLKSEVTSLQCGSDDVVWFYYTGHGQDFNNKWPMFSLGETAVPLNKIHETLKTKGARLTITMYDCCNHGTGIDNQLGAARLEALATVYTTLFVKSKGDVMMCSSRQGQYSIGISTGGVFTSSFISCLNRMQDAQNVNWNKLYEEVKTETQKVAQSLYKTQIDGNCNPDANGKCQQCPDAAIAVNSDQIKGSSDNSNAPDETKPTKVIKW